jgi:acylaminoacyl-peptidase
MVDNIPSDLSIGQAIWGVDNKSLVFVGWNNEPRRLGLVAFTNRRCALYYWQSGHSNLCKLTPEDVSVRSPRLCPDKAKLVYLESKLGSPHESCSKLSMVRFTRYNSMEFQLVQSLIIIILIIHIIFI